MANAIEKVNTIAILDIEKINTRTDDNIQALNTLEFTGVPPYTHNGLVWSTYTVTPWSGAGALKIGTGAAGGSTEGSSTSFEEWESGSWSGGGSTSIRHGAGHSGGSLAAGVICGGYDNVAADDTVVTELYNGSSWSTSGSMINGSAYGSGGGYLQTGFLVTGGSSYNPTVRDITVTQTFNGSTWTNESVASSGHNQAGIVGTTDAFVYFNGNQDGVSMVDTARFWNGSAWSTLATSPTDGYEINAFGVETRAFKAGGYGSDFLGAPNYYSLQSNVEMWVSDTWSTETALPAAQSLCGQGGGEGGGGSDGIAGWTAGGYTRSGSSGTDINTHYIAADSG